MLVIFASSLRAEDTSSIQQPDDEGWEEIFDGKSLDGWRSVPSGHLQEWSVRDGVLLGEGREDRQVYLVYEDDKLADFELKLEYRMLTKGNSGVQIRARVDRTGKRPLQGYQADFGHVGIGDQVLGAWDFHFADREEYACYRGTRLLIDANGDTHTGRIPDAVTTSDISKDGWNRLHIVAKGSHLWFSINDRKAAEFTDNMQQRFERGLLGLQLHDAGMKTEFRAIRLKRL